MNRIVRVSVILLISCLAGGLLSAQERDRSKIPDTYKWKLSDIYPTGDAWRAAKESLATEIPGIDSYRGTLSRSAGELAGCLERVSAISREFARLAVYAQMSSDVDTRDSKYLAMSQEMRQMGSDFSARASFIDPEILGMDRSTVEAFIEKEPRLKVYRHELMDILRRKAHTGTEGEEKIIADAGLMADAPGSINNIFSNADFPFPDLTLSDGKSVRLDKSGFNLYRTVEDRKDREKVFAAYFGRLSDYGRTFGTQLNAEVKKDMFYMKARKYGSSLESALDGANIPVSVYKSLVDNVSANLPTFHRYLKLRQRLLAVDTLHYYDLYAPVVKGLNLRYTVEEAQKIILAALAPLGEDYLRVARRAFSERWIDVYPSDGKRAGAYSQGGAYDVHPYILMNFNGTYDDVSTLAHELGHTVHSYLANTTQPYPLSHYSIFVAEVASTFNEALLIDYMLKTVTDDDVRLTLLMNYLDGVRGTLFRQTQFAEFELRMHEMAEAGRPITGDALSELYESITRKYYGHDAGVCVVDEPIRAEWMNIPHFFLNFYVYQYSTSITASAAISEKVLAGEKGETKNYLAMLAAGGSDYPITLLKNAGVDMTTSAPFTLLMNKMKRFLDETEKILQAREKRKAK